MISGGIVGIAPGGAVPSDGSGSVGVVGTTGGTVTEGVDGAVGAPGTTVVAVVPPGVVVEVRPSGSVAERGWVPGVVPSPFP